MNAAIPPSPQSPIRQFVLPLLIIAAFAAGFILRGMDFASPRQGASASAARPEERPAASDSGGINRYAGVVEEVGSDSVVVMAPDRPGPDARQHLVTLRVTAHTRINSLLEKGLEQGQLPEEGGDSASLGQIMKNDLVGFTGGSPFDATEIDAATITIIGRAPPRGATGG